MSATSCVRLEMSRTFYTFFLTLVASEKKLFKAVQSICIYTPRYGAKCVWTEDIYTIYILLVLHRVVIESFESRSRRLQLDSPLSSRFLDSTTKKKKKKKFFFHSTINLYIYVTPTWSIVTHVLEN